MSAAAIRPVDAADIAAIQAIYAHHVLTGIATFEEEAPSIAEIDRRCGEIVGRGLPYLVAERAGRVLGYAYAGPYRARSAYRFTLEDSIYLDPAAARQGIGRRLLERLIAEAAASGARQLVAVIGDSGNAASIALHARAGFAHVGMLRAVGFKFGRWVDTVEMQRPLGPGDASLPGQGR
ncbi:MAG: N-acetyltransferase family protein [Amaricoccus sp.]